jgi:hypothetical protein
MGEERINLRTVAGWTSLAVTCVLLVFWLGIIAVLIPLWGLAAVWKWFYLD